MSETYSIAEARKQFTQIIRSVEESETVTVMRHGKAVAVILSIEDYNRFKQFAPQKDFISQYHQYRNKWQDIAVGNEEDSWAEVRDTSSVSEDNPWL